MGTVTIAGKKGCEMNGMMNTMTAEEIWDATLAQVKATVDKQTFSTWFSKTSFASTEERAFIVHVENAFIRDMLEKRLTGMVERLLQAQTGDPASTVEFRIASSQPDEAETAVRRETADFGAKTTGPERGPVSASRYTFANFITGGSNEFACSACKAVARGNNASFNPLFIYSGVGLGKTHLLRAIGNEIEATTDKKVLYVTSEEFTNDFISSLQNHESVAFREKYRTADVLLIDDIQFIIGKESTQEAFFHTFNALYLQDKQIVITSDRPAREMITLTERMRSRFESGLAVDIQAPPLELRIAILKSKAEKTGRNVPMEVLNLIAQRVQTNIRELEGALTRVLALSDLCGIALDRDIVNAALGEMELSSDVRPVDEILSVVGSVFGAEPEAILSRNRSKTVALARQVVMYILRTEENYSYPQIGEFLGGRDHSTIIHGIEKVTGLLNRDLRFQKQYERVFTRLFGTDAKAAALN